MNIISRCECGNPSPVLVKEESFLSDESAYYIICYKCERKTYTYIKTDECIGEWNKEPK